MDARTTERALRALCDRHELLVRVKRGHYRKAGLADASSIPTLDDLDPADEMLDPWANEDDTLNEEDEP